MMLFYRVLYCIEHKVFWNHRHITGAVRGTTGPANPPNNITTETLELYFTMTSRRPYPTFPSSIRSGVKSACSHYSLAWRWQVQSSRHDHPILQLLSQQGYFSGPEPVAGEIAPQNVPAGGGGFPGVVDQPSRGPPPAPTPVNQGKGDQRDFL